MKRMQITLENGNPNDMSYIVDEVRRCRTLLDEHITVRLYGRTDNQYHPVDDIGGYVPDEVVALPFVEEDINFKEQAIEEDVTSQFVHPLMETPAPP